MLWLLLCGQVAAASDLIADAKVVVCQMEIPRESTIEALRLGRESGATTIFNPAPAVDDLEDAFFEVCVTDAAVRS